jgi:hypothetical protein
MRKHFENAVAGAIGALLVLALVVGASFTVGQTTGQGNGPFSPNGVRGAFTGDNFAPAPWHIYQNTLNTLNIGNCVGTAASPSVAACGNAASGSFSCATNATGATCVVNTTAVTAASQIDVIEDETLGTRLGVTCNTSTNVNPASRLLAARSPGVSFTINLGTVTTNPGCFSYTITN